MNFHGLLSPFAARYLENHELKLLGSLGQMAPDLHSWIGSKAAGVSPPVIKDRWEIPTEPEKKLGETQN